MQHARFALLSLALALALFVGMLLFMEVGRRLGVRLMQKRGDAARTGVGVVDGAVYGVLGLLLGFTFSGAAARWDHRRELVIQEVGAMRTAWQRIDMLEAEQQPAIRSAFRRYVDHLLDAYAQPPQSAAELHARAGATKAQNDLWAKSVAACSTAMGERARMLLLPALNLLFEQVETERLAQRVHPPMMIFAMLGVAALVASLFAGYGMAKGTARNWVHLVGVAATISTAAYVTLELESPRLGLLRVDEIDQAIVELRATME